MICFMDISLAHREPVCLQAILINVLFSFQDFMMHMMIIQRMGPSAYGTKAVV